MATSRVILEFTFRNKKFQRNPEKIFLSPRSVQRAVQQGAGRARRPPTRDLLEKKCEKKVRKNLEVTKKCVSLQSLSETGERGRTGEASGGDREDH